MTVEHVFPDWMTELLPKEPVQHTRHTQGEEPQIWSSNRIGFLVGQICSRCNTVRLSRLEDRMKPLLLRFIQGEPFQTKKRLRIDTPVQADLATWTYKTALILDRATDHPNIPAELLRRFHAEWRPAQGATVWLGIGHKWSHFAEGHSVGLLSKKDPLMVEGAVGWAVTLRIGFLVMHVVGWRTPSPPDLEPPAIWQAALTQVGPSSHVYRFWPPRPALDAQGVDRLAHWRGTPEEEPSTKDA